MPSPSPDPTPKPAVSRGARACTVCRAAKMKCVGAEDDGAKPCQRCRRSNLECHFEKHRRGRKPGSKLSDASKNLRKLEKGAVQISQSQLAQQQHVQQLSLFPVSDSRSAPLVPTQGTAPTTSPSNTYPFPPLPPLNPYIPFHTPPQRPARHPHHPPPSRSPTSPRTRHRSPTPHSHPSRSRSPSAVPDPDQDDDDDDDADDGRLRSLFPVPMVDTERARFGPGRRASFFGTVLDVRPGGPRDHRPARHAPEERMDVDPAEDPNPTTHQQGRPRERLPQLPPILASSPPTRHRAPHNASAAEPKPDLSPDDNADNAHAPSTAYSFMYSYRLGFPYPAPVIEDPISAGLLTEPEVNALFDLIHTRLNPFINLFDRALHTPQYIRTRCPLLFTTLCMVALRFGEEASLAGAEGIAPRKDAADETMRLGDDERHGDVKGGRGSGPGPGPGPRAAQSSEPLSQAEKGRRVRAMCEELGVRAWRECWKSVEVVQAFMCMTYWKEPDDGRTWTYIGYACRMAVELGLNTYTRHPPPDEQAMARLERRNRERTYLVLWVHDRSLCIQTGRLWMLPEDDLIRHAPAWYDGSTLRSIDVIVTAQVELRRAAADVTDMFFHQRAQGGTGASHGAGDVNYEIMLIGCYHRMELWDEQWKEEVKKANGGRFELSLLRFFKLHVSLFLSSLGLKSILLGSATLPPYPSLHRVSPPPASSGRHASDSSPTSTRGPPSQSSHLGASPLHRGGGVAAAIGTSMPNLPALGNSYASGLETLDLVGEFAEVGMLRYAQDSINVMTAYTAVFLLKMVSSQELVPVLPKTAPEQVHTFITRAADAYIAAATRRDPRDQSAASATAQDQAPVPQDDAPANMPETLEYHGRFLRTLAVKGPRRRMAERDRRDGPGLAQSQTGRSQHSGHSGHERERERHHRQERRQDGVHGAAARSALARLTPPDSASVPYGRNGGGNGIDVDGDGDGGGGVNANMCSGAGNPIPNGTRRRASLLYQTQGQPQARPTHGPMSAGLPAQPLPPPTSLSSPQQQHQAQQQQGQSFQPQQQPLQQQQQHQEQLLQQHQQHPQPLQQQNTSYPAQAAWRHFPASPHLPPYPLVAPDGDLALELQTSYAQSMGAANESGAGEDGSGAGTGGRVTFEEGEPSMKDIVYWYNMHNEMGYGYASNGVAPTYQQAYGYNGLTGG